MANLLKKMRKANERQQNMLNPYTNIALQRMLKYLGSTRLSRFALEDARRELIGMAAQADCQRVVLDDVLGMPEAEFCDSLAQNGRHKTPGEWVASEGLGFLGLFSLLLLLGYGLHTAGWQLAITPNLLLQLCISLPGLSLFGSFLFQRATYGPRMRGVFIGLLVLFLVGYKVLEWLLPNLVLFTIPIPVVLVVLAALLAAVLWYRRRFLRQMAVLYPWAQDLTAKEKGR